MAAKTARCRVDLTGTTSGTAVAIYATFDVREHLPQEFWTSCVYKVECAHTGIDSTGDYATYGRMLLLTSNSSGSWTLRSVQGRYTTVEADSTWTIDEIAATTGFAVRGRGNTGVAETVRWLLDGELVAVKF